MNRRQAAGALLAAAGGWAASLRAQQKAPRQNVPPEDNTTTISVEVTRVNMLCTVTDKKGRYVTDLGKDDFQVFDRKKPQVIQEFASESDLPLRLAILVDTSNSIRDRFRFEQEAASEFIKSVVHPDHDKALVMSFDTSAEMVSDMISDAAKLEDAIDGLRPGGGTALYDAIRLACGGKLQQDRPSYKFRRAVVVLSDGEDNQSLYTRDQALETAQKADAVIYAISTNITRIDTEGDKVLKYFTQETGGRAFFPFKVEDLEESFASIADELRHQYDISYRPEPLALDGTFHPVDLRVKGHHKDLIVRARKGYYAPRM